MYALIMAGGDGKRFWPVSRTRRPKQFLPIGLPSPMIRHTFENVSRLIPPENVIVITNREHVGIVKEILPEVPERNVIGEPCGRDTAPCVGLGAQLIESREPDAVMVCLPADHIIKPVSRFVLTLRVAAAEARRSSSLITLGIKPTYPATGYGYVRRAELITKERGLSVYRALRFEEKPALPVARRFVRSGRYYWNSGIFIWRTSVILGCLKRDRRPLYDCLRRLASAMDQPGFEQALADEYARLERKSIDYAVMEKEKDIKVIEAPFQWNDVGSWRTFYDLSKHDRRGNVVKGLGELLVGAGAECTGCLVLASEKRLIGLAGVSDLIVVDSDDATLIVHKAHAEKVKQLHSQIAKHGLERFL